MDKGLNKAYSDAEKPGINYLIAMPLRILYHFRTCVEYNEWKSQLSTEK